MKPPAETISGEILDEVLAARFSVLLCRGSRSPARRRGTSSFGSGMLVRNTTPDLKFRNAMDGGICTKVYFLSESNSAAFGLVAPESDPMCVSSSWSGNAGPICAMWRGTYASSVRGDVKLQTKLKIAKLIISSGLFTTLPDVREC